MMLTSSTSWKTSLVQLVILSGLMSIIGVTLATVNSLVGLAIAPDPRWATLPVSATIIGGALSTFFVSLVMQRWGRRAGFLLGAGVGIAGSLVAAHATATSG